MKILFESLDAILTSLRDRKVTVVRRFKRALVEQTLAWTHGNRTQAARTLGLQRTHLLRLIRDLEVEAPPPAQPRIRGIPARPTLPTGR